MEFSSPLTLHPPATQHYLLLLEHSIPFNISSLCTCCVLPLQSLSLCFHLVQLEPGRSNSNSFLGRTLSLDLFDLTLSTEQALLMHLLGSCSCHALALVRLHVYHPHYSSRHALLCEMQSALSPFDRGRNWGLERRNDLLKVTCEVCPEEVQPLLISREQFAWQWCDLAAKESGLECACVNDDNFTVLVRRGQWAPLSEHVYCVAVTFKMTEWEEQQIYIKFCVKLEHSLMETILMIPRLQLWATGDRQLHHNHVPPHASRLVQSIFDKTSNHSGDSAPLQSRSGTLRLLAFPKTKITLENQEISDHQWDSEKYDGASDGELIGKTVRFQGVYFEGDCGIIVVCIMFLVSYIFFNKCLHFSYYMAGYLLADLVLNARTWLLTQPQAASFPLELKWIHLVPPLQAAGGAAPKSLTFICYCSRPHTQRYMLPYTHTPRHTQAKEQNPLTSIRMLAFSQGYKWACPLRSKPVCTQPHVWHPDLYIQLPPAQLPSGDPWDPETVSPSGLWVGRAGDKPSIETGFWLLLQIFSLQTLETFDQMQSCIT